MPQPGSATRRTDWIVVANEAAAVVYARGSRRGPLEKVLGFRNDDARLKTAELVSDRDGRSFDSHGQGRHAMSRERTGPKRHAAEAFAKRIAARMQKALHDGQCEAYALIAAPRFLGMLRKELAGPGLPEPFLSLDKDMVTQDAETIRDLLT